MRLLAEQRWKIKFGRFPRSWFQKSSWDSSPPYIQLFFSRSSCDNLSSSLASATLPSASFPPPLYFGRPRPTVAERQQEKPDSNWILFVFRLCLLLCFCFFCVCVAAALNDATFCFRPIIYAPRIVSETTISGNEKILSRDRPQHNNKKLLTSDAGNVTLQQMWCLILLFCKNGNNCDSLRF